jgi:murein DD-endopeptidase MepM/ murein hydrolase activator NlpD
MAAMKKPKNTSIFGSTNEPHTIIIARGETIRHFTMKPWMAYLGGTLALGLAASYLVATSYLIFRDDLITGSVARQARLQQAYEDRIAALRIQLDRVTSRQLLDQKLMDGKVSELIQRQKALSERTERLAPVLQNAGEAGTLTSTGTNPVVNSEDAEGFYGIDPIITGPATTTRKPAPRDDKGTRRTDKAELLLDSIDRSLTRIESLQARQMLALSNTAYENADRIIEALAATGVTAPGDAASGTGGPLLLAGTSPAAGFDTRFTDLDEALHRLESARNLAKSVPIANPVPGMPVSSPFGSRADPLLGMIAFHSGMDFRAISGSLVHATASGTVTAADYNGGYGNMVEIDHGNGFATRYGHLSQILVSVGQRIDLGDALGKVGSTGRSTGPHLHYEVRRNGAAVNPVSYMAIGRQLAAEL